MLIKITKRFIYYVLIITVTLVFKTTYAKGSQKLDNVNLQKQTQQNIDRNLRNLQNITPSRGI